MLYLYRVLTHIIAPLIPLWLHWRTHKGKEDKKRLLERYGQSHFARPDGFLLWIHAASVGEAVSMLRLIQLIRTNHPKVSILLTTGTVTSAQLMAKQLPKGVLHHYVPIDTADATERFMRHWLPDMAWFVESELWPNLIMAAKKYHCFMVLINARMSQRSFTMWQRFSKTAHDIMSSFHACFAQSEADATRIRALGANKVCVYGNLKYDAAILSCNESELLSLNNTIQHRKRFLAASTHPGEEIMIAKQHAQLRKTYPDLLTIIVPRHPHRGKEIAKELESYGTVALRSEHKLIPANTNIYIADTLGELGLWYRLCPIVFMGGSLVAHGGQNPLEPARLACAIISGSFVHNFVDIYNEMQQAKAVCLAKDETGVGIELDKLLADFSVLDMMQTRAKTFVTEKGGAAEKILANFAPIFDA